MWDKLYPNLWINSIYDLETELLREKGISGILIDMDNTLVPWGCYVADAEVVKWIESLKEKGFKLCMVSNSTPSKGKQLSLQLGIPGVWNAVKPRSKAFRRALAKLNVKAEETAVIGDQIFTDVLGGNFLGLFTILVPQLSSRDFVWTKIMRKIEKKVLQRMELEEKYQQH